MDISLICFESNIGSIYFFNIADEPPVTLTSNSKEGNTFCPGELIIVKCSVMNPSLVWQFGESSFVIERKENRDYLSFYVRPWGRSYLYLNSSIGRLNFYRNETYAGSSDDLSHSFVNSEFHIRLNHANDFIGIWCNDYQGFIFKMIKITVLPGTLNIA